MSETKNSTYSKNSAKSAKRPPGRPRLFTEEEAVERQRVRNQALWERRKREGTQRVKIPCPVCQKLISRGNIAGHKKRKHSVGR